MKQLLVHVRSVLGRDPFDGSAYVFRNRSGSRLKVLYADAQGYSIFNAYHHITQADSPESASGRIQAW